MSTFEEACLLSFEKRIDSLPDEIPEHKFSNKHNKKMKELIIPSSNESEYKLTKKTIKLFLIAAVLLIGAITAFANQASREFIITKFFNHSEYNVSDISNAEQVRSLTVNYVPEGFNKVEDYGYLYVYRNGDKEFVVEKSMITASIGYDTEEYDDEIIEINGIEAVYYKSNDVNNGIIFNNGEYIFWISGNISKEEIVKIAQNIE